MLRHRVLAMLPSLVLTSCCPPEAAKPTIPPSGGGGGGAAPASAAPTDPTLGTLSEGGKLRGFTTTALYLDDADKPIGAQFVHDATGFTFDYLRIETAPDQP